MSYKIDTERGLSYLYDNDGNAIKTCAYVDFGSGKYEYYEVDSVDPAEVDRVWTVVADQYATKQENLESTPALVIGEDGKIVL